MLNFRWSVWLQQYSQEKLMIKYSRCRLTQSWKKVLSSRVSRRTTLSGPTTILIPISRNLPGLQSPILWTYILP